MRSITFRELSVGWVAGLPLLVAGCGLCGEQVLAEVKSPDLAITASIYERDCGATTGYVYHVNIHSSSDKLRADVDGTIKKDEVFTAGSGSNVSARWITDRELQIICSPCEKASKQEQQWNNLRIRYVTDSK